MAGELRLPDGWQYTRIGELRARGVIAEIQDGNHGELHPKASDYVADGIPFIMAKDLEGGRLDWASCQFIPKSLADSLRVGFAKHGDVLLTHKATMGRVAIVPEGFPYVMLTPQVTYYRIRNKDQLVPGYLKFAFLGPDFQHQLIADSDQSTRKYIGITAKYIGITAQDRLKIPLPPPAEQRRIAEILGALDDKIELNREMNETLEAMTRALFRLWFVDFDPVRAKAEGRDPALPKTIANLFPARLVDSDLGEIPEGWDVTMVAQLAEIVGGSTPSTTNPAFWQDGQHYWVTPKDLSTLSTPVLLNTERKITDAGVSQIGSGLLPPGSVLLSSRAPIGYLAITQIPVAINQGFIAMIPRIGIPNLFLLLWAEWAHDEIISRANGSTFLEISKANFRPIPVVRPPTPIFSAFDRLAAPLFARIVSNERECQTLGALRDALLPKLISGELRLRTAL
jgi:type I restriction enzyme, S subunit